MGAGSQNAGRGRCSSTYPAPLVTFSGGSGDCGGALNILRSGFARNIKILACPRECEHQAEKRYQEGGAGSQNAGRGRRGSTYPAPLVTFSGGSGDCGGALNILRSGFARNIKILACPRECEHQAEKRYQEGGAGSQNAGRGRRGSTYPAPLVTFSGGSGDCGGALNILRSGFARNIKIPACPRECEHQAEKRYQEGGAGSQNAGRGRRGSTYPAPLVTFSGGSGDCGGALNILRSGFARNIKIPACPRECEHQAEKRYQEGGQAPRMLAGAGAAARTPPLW